MMNLLSLSTRPMKATLHTAAVIILMPISAQANDIQNPNIVSHQFVGEITFLSNTQPLGFDLELGDPVNISVMYDKTVVGNKVTFTEFPQTLVDGMVFTLGGKSLKTSDYDAKLLEGNGGNDSFDFESETGTLDAVTPRDIRFGLDFIDQTGTLLENEDTLPDSLLPLTQFTTASGFIQQKRSDSNLSNLISFTIPIPEPSSMTALLIGGLVLARRRR